MIKGSPQSNANAEQSRQTAATAAQQPVSPEEEVGIRRDVKAINTTIMLLSQKMGYIVRNEKVLSKNILILNEKIKKLDEKVSNVNAQAMGGGASAEELDSAKSQIEELYNKVKGLKTEIDVLRSDLESLNTRYATKAELKELKYLVDAINPLEFVTYRQLKELLKK